MFERRPVLGVLILLTLVLTVWQMSPHDATVYREVVSARDYPPSVLPSSSAFALPYEQAEERLQDSAHPVLTPPFGGEDNAIEDEREVGAGRRGTYLNITSPPWLVAAAAAGAAAGAAWKPVSSSVSLVQTREVAGGEGRTTATSSNTAVSSTQSTASLTLVSPFEELLPNEDYTSLIDLKDFKFTINHDYCGDGSSSSSRRSSTDDGSLMRDGLAVRSAPSAPLVLVLVHSAPDNVYKRNTIRSTWGRPDGRARLIFLLGAVNTSTAQRAIEEESRTYDDIVQGSFVDAYRNMTYKHVMALKWYTYHCPGARYVLKTDDDVFINAPVLYDVLERVAPQRKLLLCQLVTKLSVKRTHRSKWYVSWREYPSRYYPPHCPGYSILYSRDVARELYREAQRQPFFWIDDVHITGTVAQNVNVTITPMDTLYLDEEQKGELLNRKLSTAGLVFFFTNPNLPMDEIRRLWYAVTEPAHR
ncbi:beta-1,3-galactosyltransferase brn [Anopheles bellator]|uniref:beta-1,3-galactosyltransferase brn n=1 Tax=Anopheles bellator TaxID=139047 RepID=UPI0026496786|nr:beta-1,3-galactosyltransferase brn [Anopheles bellator]